MKLAVLIKVGNSFIYILKEPQLPVFDMNKT